MTKRDYRRIVVKARNSKPRRRFVGGIKLLGNTRNTFTGIAIELTRMTAKSGTIVYAVMVRNMNTGRRYRFWKYTTIGDAWKRYKLCLTYKHHAA